MMNQNGVNSWTLSFKLSETITIKKIAPTFHNVKKR